MIKIIYTFFLGLLLALFVGMGIQAFYPAPQYPEYPSALEPKSRPIVGPDSTTTTETEEIRQARIEHDQKVKDFQKQSEIYHRNASLISLGFAVLLLAISLVTMQNIDVISDGLLLGGVFILFYSVIQGFASRDTKYQFLVVTAGLIIAFILGYLKFIKPLEESQKKS